MTEIALTIQTMFYMWNIFCISGQHKRSLSDVKEDATVPEGAEHGEWDEDILLSHDSFSLLMWVLSTLW